MDNGSGSHQVHKDHKSSVCLIPPSDAQGPIQALRKVHDKQINRWPPHINLLYPFVPHNQFPGILAKLTEVGTRVRPFRLSFTEFGYFSHGKNSSTVWLGPDTQPENALQRLEEELVKAFPEFNDLMVRSATFSPHLTVGQFGAKVKAAPLFCFLFGF